MEESDSIRSPLLRGFFVFIVIGTVRGSWVRFARLGIVIERLMPVSVYICLDDHRITPSLFVRNPHPTTPTMASFFDKLEHLAERLPEGVEHARAMAIGM